MTTPEMHVWFRQYAQQMGMQNNRAILPEQIDLLINTSITDTVNQLITQSIGVTNDRVITDNSKIGQINALRTLYTVEYVDMQSVQNPSNTDSSTIYFALDMSDLVIHSFIYFVDAAIQYIPKSNVGYKTNWFPIRIIDDMYLADTLNDFILKPRLRSPIMVIHDDSAELYIDNQSNYNNSTVKPYRLRISVIRKPATVKYAEDLGGSNVNCDLPDYLHIDILKHAVDLYRISVSGALSNVQQQAQQQQQENTRNNYRNDSAQ